MTTAELKESSVRTISMFRENYIERTNALISKILHCEVKNVPRLDHHPKLLLASAPKSASTWLTQTLTQAMRLPALRSYLDGAHNEQEIEFAHFAQARGKSCLFVQQHIRASEPTIRFCIAFNCSIVVLTRNVADALVSFHDHILTESASAPMFFMKQSWFTGLDNRDRYDFLIDHCLPWYTNFLIGWISASKEFPELIDFIRYEDLVTAPNDAIARISAHSGLKADIQDSTPLIGDDVRFNRGVCGRGAELLSRVQLDRIAQSFKYYPSELGYESFAFAAPAQPSVPI